MTATPICWACDSRGHQGWELALTSPSSPSSSTVVALCRPCVDAVDTLLRHRRCRESLLRWEPAPSPGAAGSSSEEA